MAAGMADSVMATAWEADASGRAQRDVARNGSLCVPYRLPNINVRPALVGHFTSVCAQWS